MEVCFLVDDNHRYVIEEFRTTGFKLKDPANLLGEEGWITISDGDKILYKMSTMITIGSQEGRECTFGSNYSGVYLEHGNSSFTVRLSNHFVGSGLKDDGEKAPPIGAAGFIYITMNGFIHESYPVVVTEVDGNYIGYERIL